MDSYYEDVSGSGSSGSHSTATTMVPNQGSGAHRMPYEVDEEGGNAIPPVPPILPAPRQPSLKWIYAGVATMIVISVATLVLVAILLSTRQEATTPALDSSPTRGVESTTTYPGIYILNGHKI